MCHLRPFTVLFSVLLVGSLGGRAVAQQGTAQNASGSKITAQNITDAVEDELQFEPAVPLNDIDVRTKDGVVTLTGTVDSLLAKNYASDIASTVKGVRSVVNKIVVAPRTNLMDWEIRDRVETALMQDPATRGDDIEVAVHDGVATLTGPVPTHADKELAEGVAMGVDGVSGVIDGLSVESGKPLDDARIAQNVRDRLTWDALVDDGLIDVDVDDHRVELSGTVGSSAEKSRAIEDAWVTGVRDVDAKALRVDRWARDGDLAKDVSIATDAAIAHAVDDNFRYDPRVRGFDVSVDVDDGVATLRGTVDNLRAKRAAETDAHDTFGVLAVDNRIRVRPTVQDDDQLASRIEDALRRDPYLGHENVDVAVIGGTAYLGGDVDSYFEKARADSLAAGIYGVTSVKNRLAVDEPMAWTWSPYAHPSEPYEPDVYDWSRFAHGPGNTTRTDDDIRRDIDERLWWSPFVDSEDVDVKVQDGVATLEGTVSSWAARETAADKALEGGALAVHNELRIEPNRPAAESGGPASPPEGPF